MSEQEEREYIQTAVQALTRATGQTPAGWLGPESGESTRTPQVLAECGKTIDDVDVYIPHQANVRIIDHAAEKLGIPKEKIVVNVERYGNTSWLDSAGAGGRAGGGAPAGGLARAHDRYGCGPHVGLWFDRMDDEREEMR